MLRKLITTCVLIIATATAALAQQYTLTDITPPGADAAAMTTSMYDAFQPAGALYFGGDFSGPNAAIWDGFSQSVVNLHPAALFDIPSINGFGRSVITGTVGFTQVGYGSGPNTNQRILAVAWNGTADSAAVLPVPFSSLESQALGAGFTGGPGAGQIVGFAYTVQSSGGRGTLHFFSGPPHALLWDAVTHVAVDLHNGAQGTVAVATTFGNQVGYGGTYPPVTPGLLLEQPRAMLWRGSPSNFVWLHPQAGYQASEALATDGIQEAGWGQVASGGGRTTTTPPTHAMMWTNTAASFVDLHPAGFVNSYAAGVAGGVQVGYGVDAAGTSHALVWSGSAASVIDLNPSLPAGFTGARATGIDATGNISGTMEGGGRRHAVIWTPIR
jgi:hypothetical protein